MKEFFQHPGWEGVFNALNALASDLKDQVFTGTTKEFEERRGKAFGVFEAIGHLKLLIKNHS